MSRKIDFFIAISAVIIVWVAPAMAQNVVSGEARLAVRVSGSELSESPLVLGQDEAAKKPGLFDRIKQSFSNWARDEEEFGDDYHDFGGHNSGGYEPERSNRRQREEAVPATKPVSVPTKPPKPVTATEVRKAVENPEQASPSTERRSGTTGKTAQDRRTTTAQSSSTAKPAPPATTATSVAKSPKVTVSTEEPPEPVRERIQEPVEVVTETVSEDTIFERLKSIREQVFDKEQIDENLYQEGAGENEQQRISQAPVERTAPMPAPANTPKTVRQTPTARVQPPPSSFDEPTRRRAAPISAPTYETPYETAYENSVEEPMPQRTRPQPLQSQTVQRERPTVTATTPAETESRREVLYQDDLRQNTVRRETLPSPTRRQSLTSSQRNTDDTEVVESRTHRTAPLSGVGVYRPDQQRNTNLRTQTNSRSRERLPEHRPETAQKDSEYEISARRMLSTDQEEPTERVASAMTEPFLSTDTVEPLSRKKNVLVSPRLEVETESDPRAIVGQEATYKIRVRNEGGAPADQVVLSLEIPEWIEIRQPDVSVGTTSIVPRAASKEIRDFHWKISRIEANGDALLVLRLVPQQRKSMDLKIRYDFFKPTAVTKLVVQEPVIEMELEGPDEVLWGTRVGYRLLVRNVGNGDAENVQLELLQTGSDMKSCELAMLRAGEEQVIDVDVWTGKQESIDINIQATGRYDLSAKVSKLVKVMRPNVVMTIDAPTIQFVGSPAEFVLKVRNVGNAVAKNIELAATLPLGARFESCTKNGELNKQNQIVWQIDAIPVGDTFTTSIVCEPKREGSCKLDATVGDKSGVLTQCDCTFEAAAIIELKLDVDNPRGPIEVGREAVYAVHLMNRGTKAAENVEVTVCFGKHLEPYAIEGGTAYTSDGQVVFDKIPTLGPEQRLTMKVKARAEESGSHRVRTEVRCAVSDIHLVNEQATYFYKKEKGKSLADSREEVSKPVSKPIVQEPIRKTPVPPSVAKPTTPAPTALAAKPAEKKSSEPPPLPVLVPPSPAPSGDTKPVDPFLRQSGD